MSLDKGKLEKRLTQLFDNTIGANVDAEQAKSEFIKGLVEAIDDYTSKVEIIYTTGLVAPPGGGAVTGTFEHKVK